MAGQSFGSTWSRNIPIWSAAKAPARPGATISRRGVFKEMTRLTKQKAKLEELLSGVNAFNAKGKAAEIGAFLDKYIPAVEQMHTTLKKYNTSVHGHDCRK